MITAAFNHLPMAKSSIKSWLVHVMVLSELTYVTGIYSFVFKAAQKSYVKTHARKRLSIDK